METNKIHRAFHRDSSRIFIDFWTLVRAFEEAVKDDHFVKEDVFNRYNRIWINHCEKWKNLARKNAANANVDAFEKYINNEAFEIVRSTENAHNESKEA